MATKKDLIAVSQTIDTRASAYADNIRVLFETIIECFDDVLQTKEYQLVAPDQREYGGFDSKTIASRNASPWSGAMGRVRGVQHGNADFLRIGIIPDPGVHFMVLWVDLKFSKNGAAVHLEPSPELSIDLASFDATQIKMELKKIVQAATDDLLKLYEGNVMVVSRAINRFFR